MIKRKIPYLFIFLAFLVLLSALGFLMQLSSPMESHFALAAGKPTPLALQIESEIELAVLEELNQRQGFMPVAVLYEVDVERVTVSSDGKWGAAWLVKQDRQTGEILETEPGLALLQRQADEWQVALPGDFTWSVWLESAPEDLLPPGEKEQWQIMNAASQVSLPSAPLGGYLLPWEGGVKGTLTGSLAHDAYLSCNSHFAFDFIIRDPATGRGGLFPIRAAKGGTVWRFWDGQPRGDESAPNYIVLKDTTTNPVTYQLYLHLDQNSIPPELKVIGKYVSQGEVIGVADDTGLSTGHHLHFMVYSVVLSDWWGKSVDITFDDVKINGGRPRILNDLKYCNNPGGCADTEGFTDICDSVQNDYISGNVFIFDETPPTGGLTAPAHKVTIEAGQIQVSGWAQDDVSGLLSAQVKAYYGGAWHSIGTSFTTSPFSFTWDLCQAGVPDGPVTLSLSLADKKNNAVTLDGAAVFIKSYNCPPPPPACSPTDNQVAVFTQANYIGSCAVFSAGSYDNGEINARIGEDTAVSVQVGSNVRATLYSKPGFSGRSETLWQSDSNLEDNLVGSQSLSSMQVRLKTDPPSVPQLVWPSAGGTITQTHSLNLYWRDAGGAAEFQARLTRGDSTITSNWQKEPFWNLGTGIQGLELTAGSYTWQVRARNPSRTSAWSTAQSFTIVADTLPTSVIQAPFMQDFESDSGGWTGTGYWHYVDSKPIENPTHSWWFGAFDGDFGHHYFYRKSGDLTSPEIILPSSGAYYLRFKYRAQTESNGRFWDQRWVQIKVGNGTFQNLFQLTDDPRIPYSQPDILWMNSPVIDLSAYQGQKIRIRFHFDTIDPSFQSPDNDYEGWYIDEVSITTQPPPNCVRVDEPNDTPAQAGSLSAPFSQLIAELCPAGDLDYFKFNGQAGALLKVDLDKLLPSDLDAHLTLLDADGSSVLAVNDDERFPDILDPLLVYQLPRTGTYYLKIKAWDHPGDGAPEYLYRLSVYQDPSDPEATVVFPQDRAVVYPGLKLRIQASDAHTGVDRVEWYYHSSNWSNPAWTFLGNAVYEQGYWNLTYPVQNSQFGVSLLALIYDKAGQVTPRAVWDVSVLSAYYSTWLPVIFR